MYKKILQSLVFCISLTAPFSVSHAEQTVTLASPFFITNPIKNPPKTSGIKKPFLKKSFNVLDHYTVEKSGVGVTLYKHNESEVYIQKIDLARGVRFGSVGQPIAWDEVTGEPLFPKNSLSEQLGAIQGNPFSLINGQFFDPKRNPTPLSFGLKVDGEVKTAGGDNRDESKNILTISEGKAQILPYSWENLRDAPGYFAIVNLSPSEKHYRDEEIGRTYICLAHPDATNTSSELIVMVAVGMSEPFSEKELTRWGCTKKSITKLDSSGSARLAFDNTQVYGKSHDGSPDYRRIPQAITIWDGQ